MYTEANIIYGIRLTDAIRAIEDKPTKLEKLGFDFLYSGSAEKMPAYLGVRLGTIDECDDVKLSDLIKLLPNPAQIQEAQQKIDKLPADIKKVIDKPETWLVWFTT